jgi:hypothetical protein
VLTLNKDTVVKDEDCYLISYTAFTRSWDVKLKRYKHFEDRRFFRSEDIKGFHGRPVGGKDELNAKRWKTRRGAFNALRLLVSRNTLNSTNRPAVVRYVRETITRLETVEEQP